MKFQNFYKCITITTLLSQFAILPEPSYAMTENKTEKVSEAEMVREENPINGLLGYYFKDAGFNELAVIQTNTPSQLYLNNKVEQALSEDERKGIQSARWIGYIQPSKTGEYEISTSIDQNIIVQLNEDTIINQAPMKKHIKLEQGKLYEIKVEYLGDTKGLSNLALFWSTPNSKKEQIPIENLIAPKFAEKADMVLESSDYSLIPNSNLFYKQENSTLKDSDKDGIPDDWELNGYTVKNHALTKWNDTYNTQGYKKYLSNPYKARTVADPYTDFEKVTGYMPAAVKAEAKDPLVAAYPSVGVGMESFSFSKNENVTTGNSNTKTKGTTKTSGSSDTVDVSVNAGFSAKDGFSLGVSAGYSHTWDNSTSFEDTDGESWSNEIGINTNDAAFLNANVRYYNTGTAPIYEVRPTTNFVFKKANESITTIKAGPNQIGNSLAPGNTYPKKGQAPISLNQANEAGTVNISINAEQLNSLQTKSEILNLETTQSSGQYAVIDPVDGHLVTDASKQWDHIRSNIDATSGSLILETGKESLERRVGARDANDPEDKTPEITVGEAIKKAFGAIEKNGQLYYKEADTGKEISIHESSVNIIVDKKTEAEFHAQLKNMTEKNIYNITFKRGMNITIYAPLMYSDFESNNEDFNNIILDNGGHTGKNSAQIAPKKAATYKKNLKLEPYTSYTLRMWVKTSEKNKKAVQINLGKGVNYKFESPNTEWNLVEVPFNTGEHPENFESLVIQNDSDTLLNFDDLALIKWATTENFVKNSIVDDWKKAENGTISGVSFLKIPKTPIRFQLEIDGKLTDIKSTPPIDSQGKLFIDFKEFNNGNGIYAGSNIIVYAIDEKNENLKVKIAAHEGKKLLDSLTPSQVQVFFKDITKSFAFEIKTGANAPKANYKLVNLSQNITHNMWEGENNTSMWVDYLTLLNPKDEYAVFANVSGLEYMVYKEMGENISGLLMNGIYEISSIMNDRVVDLNMANNHIILWDNKNSGNQKWKFVYDRKVGAYQIKNMSKEDYVLSSAYDFQLGSPTELIVFPNHQKDSQYWIPEFTSDGYFIIKNYKNKRWVLDVENGDPVQGGNIILYPYAGAMNQKFHLKKID